MATLPSSIQRRISTSSDTSLEHTKDATVDKTNEAVSSALTSSLEPTSGISTERSMTHHKVDPIESDSKDDEVGEVNRTPYSLSAEQVQPVRTPIDLEIEDVNAHITHINRHLKKLEKLEVQKDTSNIDSWENNPTENINSCIKLVAKHVEHSNLNNLGSQLLKDNFDVDQGSLNYLKTRMYSEDLLNKISNLLLPWNAHHKHIPFVITSSLPAIFQGVAKKMGKQVGSKISSREILNLFKFSLLSYRDVLNIYSTSLNCRRTQATLAQNLSNYSKHRNKFFEKRDV